MAEKAEEKHPLLRRPLYLYNLPEELLYTLTLQGNDRTPQVPLLEQGVSPEERTISNEDGVSKTTACTLCRATFSTVQDQREHVRSDFHKYNLKMSLGSMQTVNEATFVRLVDDLAESISGSANSSESEEDDKRQSTDTTLAALLRKQAKLSEHRDAESRSTKPGPGKAPLLWLSSAKLGDQIALGVYRAMLSETEQQEASEHLVDIVKRRQLTPIPAKHKATSGSATNGIAAIPHVFLCMIGGGHFAAMIVSLAPEIRKGPGGIDERHAVVIAHKTFHRYTTRRKQGGSQSANDNAKGNAHSAGSSIRRYNEAALEADVRSVLSEWKNLIESAQLLFIRATGSTNRRTLFGPYEGQVLRVNDKRLRGFPFSTRRATQAELLRSFQELTRLKVSNVTEEAIEKTFVKDAALSKPENPKNSPPKLDKEEEEALLHTTQLIALIRRSKVPATMLYLTKNNLGSDYPFFPPAEHHHAPTPLHLAASTNSPALVTALILKANANPTLTNSHGRTAYDIAGDPKTRDAFRVARQQLGEQNWDWHAAHVPSAMTQEEVDRRHQTAAEAESKAEAERRKADLDRIRRSEEERNVGKMERRAGPGRTVDLEKTGAEKREEEMRGLTPEMRVKIERERRARAAEERMKRMQAGGK